MAGHKAFSVKKNKGTDRTTAEEKGKSLPRIYTIKCHVKGGGVNIMKLPLGSQLVSPENGGTLRINICLCYW